MGPTLLLPTHSTQIFRRCKGLTSFRLYIRHYATQPDSSALQRKKVWASADAAVQDVKSGDIVLSGGMSASSRLDWSWRELIQCQGSACVVLLVSLSPASSKEGCLIIAPQRL
jgi:hypothetical protein